MERTRTSYLTWLFLFLLVCSACGGKSSAGAFSSCGVQPAAGGLLSARGIIDIEGRCWLPEETAWRHGQIFVPATTDEFPSISGAGILRVNANGCSGPDHGYVLLLYIPPGTEEITLTLSREGRPWQRRSFQFRVGTWKGSAALRAGSEALLKGESKSAQSTLTSALIDPEPATRTFARLRLAEIDGESNQYPQMLAQMEEVTKLSASYGYLSLQLSSLLNRSELHGKLDQISLAETALAAGSSPAPHLPAMEAWVGLYRGRLHKARGDYVLALSAVESGLHAAQKHLLQDAGVQLCLLKSRVLEALGRVDEADSACSEIESWMHLSALEPCLQAHSRLFLARSLLSRYEGTWPRHNRLAKSVVENLDLARTLLTDFCRGQDELLSYATLYQAQAKLLMGEHGSASKLLQEASGKLGDYPPAARRSWTLLRGQLALAQENWQQAIDSFTDYLSGEQEKKPDPASRTAASPETRWNGYLGLAQAHQGLSRSPTPAPRWEEETKLAVDYYQRAERVLDDWSRDYRRLPFVQGRQSFLDRFKRGTSLFIDLLSRRERKAEALAVLLHAHRRMLGAFSAQWLGQQEASTLRERYWTERQQLQDSLTRDPPSNIEAREQQLTTATKKMLGLIEEGLAAQAKGPVADPALDFGPNELLLACHPGVDGEICLGATSNQEKDVKAVLDVRALSPERNREDLAAQILKPFARQLEKAKTVRVLANDTLLRIPVHLLPLFGELAGAKWRVLYTLGLPSRGEQSAAELPAPERRTFVMVPEPGTYHLDAEAVTKSVLPQLEKLGWPVPKGWQILGSSPPATSNALPTGPLQELRQRLQDAWLFHFAGHVADGANLQWVPGVPTGIQSPPIMLSDILMLSRIVPHVLLIGCSTGAGPRPGSNIRLGQAFLLRGSQEAVVSAEQIDTGAPFVNRLYPYLRQDGDPLPLASAFQRALAENHLDTEAFRNFFVLTR